MLIPDLNGMHLVSLLVFDQFVCRALLVVVVVVVAVATARVDRAVAYEKLDLGCDEELMREQLHFFKPYFLAEL
jgi:hypothetical protein